MSGRIERFLFAPARATPFAALRIGLAATLLAQALQVVPVFSRLYHHGGLLRGPLMDMFLPHHMPPVGRWWASLAGGGTAEWIAVIVCGVLYVASLIGMLVGWRTRVCTGAAWLLHFFFMILAPHTNYGADAFANAYLFYSLLGPGGEALSLDRRAGRTRERSRVTSRLLLRVMQLHLCVGYLFSGVEKATGEQWRNGEAIWRSLMAQRYEVIDFSWLAQVPRPSRPTPRGNDPITTPTRVCPELWT